VGAALAALPAAERADQSELVLWYRNPAKEWTEALPVGTEPSPPTGSSS
jgi:hypothetical protein